MYRSPFDDVLEALATDIKARLSKGEPLDANATTLYGKLAEEACALACKEGDESMFVHIAELVRDGVVDAVDNVAKAAHERTEQAKLANQTAQRHADTAWVPSTPLDLAIRALGTAQDAVQKARTDEERTDAGAALKRAEKDYETAVSDNLGRQARANVLTRLENALLDEIATQRMHDGSPERIEKLEEKLFAVVYEAAQLRGAYGYGINAAGG